MVAVEELQVLDRHLGREIRPGLRAGRIGRLVGLRVHLHGRLFLGEHLRSHDVGRRRGGLGADGGGRASS